eukprot:364749-Chlamydomonas_euryale.AAC.6
MGVIAGFEFKSQLWARSSNRQQDIGAPYAAAYMLQGLVSIETCKCFYEFPTGPPHARGIACRQE